MSRPLAIGAIILAVGAAGFGVYQYLEVGRLRASLAALDQERADLRKKLWEAERRTRTVAATAPTPAPTATEPVASPAEPLAGDRRGNARRFGGDMAGRVVAALDNPEAQRLMSIQQKGALDNRYAALFRELKLPPDQLEKFKSLLVERQTAAMDVMAAAREQGLNPFENRDEIRQLVKTAQDEVESSIRTTIGDTAYAQYQNYDNTYSQRTVVSQLEQRLSYSSTPLTPAQSSQLVQILAQQGSSADPTGPGGATVNTAVYVADGAAGRGAGGRFQVFAGGANFGGAPISTDAVNQASTVLNPQQLSALQELQAEQDAQAQLGEQMRATIGAGRGRGEPRPNPGG